jgi:hypothetical protein
MRTRLTLAIVAIVVLLPQAARAQCLQQPFDQVVRSSDAVLVATVVDATASKHGIVLRLDVEQTLKGSARDGQRVRFTLSCGPMISGQMQEQFARQLVGTRALYLLTEDPNGTFSKYSEITTPQMTTEQQIAQARQVLGLPPDATAAAQPASGPSPVTVVLIVLAIGGLIVGAWTLARRSARS